MNVPSTGLEASKLLARLVENLSVWLSGAGPQNDVVISTRLRLARNLADFRFLSRAEANEQNDIEGVLKAAIIHGPAGGRLVYLALQDLDEVDRMCLVERHLISKQHADAGGPRGVAITSDESVAIMVNEEDHLRIQVFRAGMQLDEAWAELNRLDDQIESQVAYAFSSRFGYLTACPTNVGTGLRVSVMLHLPALRLTGEIEKVFRVAKEWRLAIRGLYGEGTDYVGDFFQISNQTSLGRSEEEIIAEFQNVMVPKVVEYEKNARKTLLLERKTALEDKVWRALGVLKHARALSSDEILALLSHLRMGVCLGRVERPDLKTINELLLLTQPAHLQKHQGLKLTGEQRSIERANYVRGRLELN